MTLDEAQAWAAWFAAERDFLETKFDYWRNEAHWWEDKVSYMIEFLLSDEMP